MAIFVSLRLFSIPFGSLFNAINKFKIRKIIEFFSYLIAAISISLIVFFKRCRNIFIGSKHIIFNWIIGFSYCFTKIFFN